jgi:hypothetical protein
LSNQRKRRKTCLRRHWGRWKKKITPRNIRARMVSELSVVLSYITAALP